MTLSQTNRKNGGAPNVSTAALRLAFNAALVQDDAKLAKAMNGFIVQRGVERPLLIKEGRKFCLRIYVVVCVRPTASSTSLVGNVTTTAAASAAVSGVSEVEEKEGKTDRETTAAARDGRTMEVYVSPLEVHFKKTIFIVLATWYH